MTASDCSAQLAALRHSGAHRLDPVRFHYLELLAQRAKSQPDKVRGILEDRLVLGLAEWAQRFEPAQAEVEAGADTDLAPVTPGAAPAPTQTPMRSSLQELLGYLAEQSAGTGETMATTGLPGAPAARTELKSVQHFRNSWSKLSAERQVNLALNQAPKNAGPINSHMLVLRSLALMREISPDYLNRFMSYVDTLLCLEQGDRSHQAAARTEADGEGKGEGKAGAKKPKARRSPAKAS